MSEGVKWDVWIVGCGIVSPIPRPKGVGLVFIGKTCAITITITNFAKPFNIGLVEMHGVNLSVWLQR